MAKPGIKAQCAFGRQPYEQPDAEDWTRLPNLREVEFRRGRENPLQEIETGEGQLILKNLDRRYDLYPYSDGPYGANVKQGRRLQVLGTYGVSEYPLFTSHADNWEPRYPARKNAALVHVPMSDGFRFFANYEATANFSQQLSGDRFVALLDEAGYPGTGQLNASGFRAIDQGFSEVVEVELEDDFILEAIKATATSVFGMAFMSKAGVFTFLDRQRWSHPSRGRFIPSMVIGDRPRGLTAVRFVGAGLNDLSASGTFTGTPISNFLVLIDSTGTPDTFTWSEDGGATFAAAGVPITGGTQALADGVSIAFGATTGHSLNDSWEWEAGMLGMKTIEPTAGIVRNKIQVTPATGTRQTVTDAASIADYGPSSQSFRASLLALDNDGLDFATRLLNQQKDQHVWFPSVEFTISSQEAKSDVLWPWLFQLELGDRVRVVHNPPGGGTQREVESIVEGIHMKWTSKHGWESVQLFLSRAPVRRYGILDSLRFGRLDVSAYLGY